MNFSKITDDLFIGSMPLGHHYDQLRFSLAPKADSHEVPINTLWLRSIDSPLFPISISKLMRGAQAALATIRAGGKVYAHCAS